MACASDEELRRTFRGRLKYCSTPGQFEKDSERDAESERESIQEMIVCLEKLIGEMLCDDVKFKILMLQNLIEDLYFLVNVIIHSQCSHAEEQKIGDSSVGRATYITKVLLRDLKNKLKQVEEIDDSIEEEIAYIESCDAYNIVKEWTTKATSENVVLPYCTNENRECHVLGLEVDFLRRFDFEKYPEEMRGHLSTEEWICKFLEEHFEQLMEVPENVHLQDKEVLERIGFRADCEAVITLLERASTLNGHLHILDLVQMYVRDEFKFNPVLVSDVCPRFPFSPDKRREWVSMSHIGNDKVTIINLEKIDNTTYSEKYNCPNHHHHREVENESQRVLFHGTDHDSARSIFRRGICISEGRKNRDFSSSCGFYLTDDFKHSVEWAFSTTRKPAVLVYIVDRNQLQCLSGYSLVGLEKRSEWIDQVRQYRSGNPTKELRKLMRQHDYIEGPQASTYDPVEPEPKDGTYQMCLISNKLAKTLDMFLHSALFFDEN